MSKKIAIITARGGSKRIPRKNIKEFCGKPIISYSIEAAIQSGVFDEVMVSTDDNEIAAIAKKYGACVPFMRSGLTSSDYATTKDVLLEVIEQYQKLGKNYDYMCCIYPTAPFVSADKLKKSIEMIEEKKVQQIMPIVEYSFPPQRSNIIDDNGEVQYKFPENRQIRSQDLESWYHDAGQFYVYDVEKFIQTEGICTQILPIIVSELEVQDIDNEIDWKLAEIKYKLMLMEKKR